MRPAATRWGRCWLLCTLVSGKGKFYPSTCAGAEYDPWWEDAVEGTGARWRPGTTATSVEYHLHPLGCTHLQSESMQSYWPEMQPEQERDEAEKDLK